ncbi:glycosyltransferase family 4 protein [Puia dinghuensis]|uniref:Glycosyl transferase n=1 Tax=Puia dinghuensis TaxID=1792502 RepID=A0A8J2XTS3_9BACT|nr:glycosyltransferase family 4 protein [Puia dinghuensis]GGB06316.1 glycosyl transferase [Puia dinghuensis]
MNVLFIARASLYTNRGGDTIQLLKTAEYLGKLGVKVDIRLTDEEIDYSGYQLLHFFNIIRPADILKHIRQSSKPYVVSPIYVDYAEADQYARRGPARLLLRFFSVYQAEYIKVIARQLFNGEKIVSLSYLWLGQRRSMRRILKRAALLLPNSEAEYSRLQRRLAITCPYRVIPNAIDPAVFRLPADPPAREDDLVLCVGRIEGMKNQLNLIRAVNGSSFRLILIGAPAVNQPAYYEECRKSAGAAITFIDAVSQKELAFYYSRARVHALPSWFETTGLSSLEAAAMGCSIVITDKGDTREYFAAEACYCDPASPASIREALEKAAKEGPSETLREKIMTQYTWPITAIKTLEAYKMVLSAASGK